jgi:hypothetical protein
MWGRLSACWRIVYPPGAGYQPARSLSSRPTTYLFLAAFLVVRFAVLFLPVLFFAAVRFVVLLLAVVFLLAVFLEARFFWFGFDGMFAPDLRASLRPIAMACFGFFTFPPRPRLSS